MEISRGDFIKLLVFVAAPVGCTTTTDGTTGTEITPTQPAGRCTTNGARATFSNNHPVNPHVLYVPSADFAGGASRAYTTSGGDVDKHRHELTLSSAELLLIASGQAVVKTTTTADGHNHDATVICA